MTRDEIIRSLTESAEQPTTDGIVNGIDQQTIRGAIAMLKEHEPIQIKILEDYGFIKFGECPKCKSFINNRVFPKSCGCGQAVKWDG